ncbi:MAG: hypothetical protein JO044_04370 [Mycobacteriaceae bacterium]|nr:hypothetical protein [Mycobacteriaceae bacterium]MBV9639099.1 hypothetical protein [Mycobacteriaceae bacterium]
MAAQTYIEASRDAALVVEVDPWGAVIRVQLEREVTRSWDAGTLGERIVRLYRLAALRGRCDERERMNEDGADLAPSAAYPSRGEIDEYRRTIDF